LEVVVLKKPRPGQKQVKISQREIRDLMKHDSYKRGKSGAVKQVHPKVDK